MASAVPLRLHDARSLLPVVERTRGWLPLNGSRVLVAGLPYMGDVDDSVNRRSPLAGQTCAVIHRRRTSCLRRADKAVRGREIAPNPACQCGTQRWHLRCLYSWPYAVAEPRTAEFCGGPGVGVRAPAAYRRAWLTPSSGSAQRTSAGLRVRAQNLPVSDRESESSLRRGVGMPTQAVSAVTIRRQGFDRSR
jgi:hypothetical protein